MATKIPSIKLTNKFIKGLNDYGLSYDEISTWKYCGGNMGSHLNYFNICCKNEVLPKRVDECVCGHRIQENCYITDNKRILILGNCCIKKFIPKSFRTCEKCKEPHKNRVVNRCNNCRKGICDQCDKKCNKLYKKCYTCYINY